MSWISGSGGGYAVSPPANPNNPVAQPPGSINVLDSQFGAKGDGVTLDTGAVQLAINAASAKAGSRGMVDVWLPPGYGFLLGLLTPKNGVRLSCYGASLLPNLPSIGVNGWLWTGFGGQIHRFAVCGGSWLGTGTEIATNNIYESGTASFPNGPWDHDVLFKDMYVENWAGGGLYVRNPQRARFLDNVFLNCNANTSLNVINAAIQSTETSQPTHDILVRGNIIDSSVSGTGGAAIAYGADTQPGLPATDLRMVVTDNICLGTQVGANNLAGSIDIETNTGTTGGPISRIIVARNIVEVFAPSGNMYAITIEALQERVIVSENILKSSNQGILLFQSPDVQLENNIIDAPIPIVGTPALQTGNRFSHGPCQGRATLVAGTVTVPTAEVQTGDNILLTRMIASGTLGLPSIGTIIPGISFVINSSNAADTSTFYWRIDH